MESGAMAVEFGLLGSIEARVGGRLVELGHARQRLLLAALLMDVNREVPIEQLADRIWGKEHAQRGTLYGYLSRLRQALAGAEGVEISHRSVGYVLVADPQTVDACRFRDLAARARAAGGDRQACELFGQALDLWRGEALGEADTPWSSTVRGALHQERLAAQLDRAELRLRLRQHIEVLAELQTLAGKYPQDERLAGLVMLALYRCGRTADALGHYQATHQVLTEELGLDPGPELQRLHQQILTGTPVLTPKAEGAASRSAAGDALVPQQLPAPPALFTGRTRELERLSAVLEGRTGAEGTVVISAIGGVGGIGKTYLALHWAHQHMDRFSEGQLYVNLRGFDPVAQPMDPSAAVCGFLEALGVASAAIPSGLDAQTAMYRSLVADKRMLVVLDNARDTNQVLPLVPGSSACTVLVTSRNQLTGLLTAHAAMPLPINALPEAEARLLLARHLGEGRLAAEPEATAALLEHCAGLPLALSITAARAAVQPDLPLAHLAEELTETETRLDALDTGDLTASLRAVFATSYRALHPEAANTFALLGLAPGPDLSLQAAASLLATTIPRARTLLRALEDAHLVQQHVPNRYRMHDLVHIYAAEHAHSGLNEEHRERALRRLVDFYLHTTRHASLQGEPQPLFPVKLASPAAGCVPHWPANWEEAWGWYDAEWPCLLAIQRLAVGLGWHTPAWQLPHMLFFFHRFRGNCRAAVATGRVGLAAAEQLTDLRPEASVHSLLGYAYALTLQTTEAFNHLEQAMTVFEQAGDLPGQALTHYSFITAVVWSGESRDPRRGLFHSKRASQLYRTLGNTQGECYSLSNAGMFYAMLGEHQQARACCEQALALAPTNIPGPEAFALQQLGFAVHHSGQYTEALTRHHQAATLWRDYSPGTFWEAVTLENLGFTYRALGQIVEARQAWQHALDLHRVQHRTTDAKRLQQKLDALSDTPMTPR